MQIYRIKDVIKVTGLSRSTIYRLMDQDRFPKSIKLSQRIIGFLEEDIEQWIQERYQEGIKHESE
jgi:prophage regulatory protein